MQKKKKKKMELESLKLSEINQRLIVYDFTYTSNLKKDSTYWYRKQIGTCQRAGPHPAPQMGIGKIGKGGQKVQTSSYKINESWGCNIQRGDCT